VEKAFKYLGAAVDYGWSHIEWTKQQEGFNILHGKPEWDEILVRMKYVAKN
jgi:hypothetical protein